MSGSFVATDDRVAVGLCDLTIGVDVDLPTVVDDDRQSLQFIGSSRVAITATAGHAR